MNYRPADTYFTVYSTVTQAIMIGIRVWGLVESYPVSCLWRRRRCTYHTETRHSGWWHWQFMRTPA